MGHLRLAGGQAAGHCLDEAQYARRPPLALSVQVLQAVCSSAIEMVGSQQCVPAAGRALQTGMVRVLILACLA